MTRSSRAQGRSTGSPELSSSKAETGWTQFNGSPVYWLSPEFWDPKRGFVKLVLPGELPQDIESAVYQKRIVEFMKLQGDPRYCTAEESHRMRRMMRDRLGSETPWKGVPPVNSSMPTARPVVEAVQQFA